jgi:predicted RNA polymerase sigma factor
VTATDTHRAIDAVWRIESARLIAGLTRIVRDVGLAEDLAQDALVAALEQWPASGVPQNPGAWLMAVAKRRSIDRLRRSKVLERKQEQLGRELEVQQDLAAPDLEAALDDDVGDDLSCASCLFASPSGPFDRSTRVAPTLRLLGSLTTERSRVPSSSSSRPSPSVSSAPSGPLLQARPLRECPR